MTGRRREGVTSGRWVGIRGRLEERGGGKEESKPRAADDRDRPGNGGVVAKR